MASRLKIYYLFLMIRNRSYLNMRIMMKLLLQEKLNMIELIKNL